MSIEDWGDRDAEDATLHAPDADGKYELLAKALGENIALKARIAELERDAGRLEREKISKLLSAQIMQLEDAPTDSIIKGTLQAVINMLKAISDKPAAINAQIVSVGENDNARTK